MAYTLTVGGVRCHIVSDGRHLMDGGGFFGLVPRTLWQRIITPNEDNQIQVETRCLLIESGDELILVDTGFGDKLSPKMRDIFGIGGASERLLAEIGQVGFKPDDVTTVLLTHLHNDHAGGCTRWAAGLPNEAEPVFVNARHIVQRIDLEDASNPNERTSATYLPENWLPLLDRGLLEVVDGPVRLTSSVRTDIAAGHTGAFQTVWVESADEALLYVGDAASWAVHLERLAWIPAFDILPMVSLETKRRLREESLDKNALIVFEHDAHVVTGRLAYQDKRLVVQPEIVEDAWPSSSKED